MAARLVRDLPGYLRAPLGFEEAGARIRRQLTERREHFLDVAERAIYRHPRSPYLKLLRHVGCEFGDLRALVQREGIEGALTALAAQGVYVTFDEFKGRREAVRGSARYRFTADEFDTPLYAPHWLKYSGGTRGEPTAAGQSLPQNEELSAGTAAMLAAHGLAGARHVMWVTASVNPMVSYLKLGQEIVRWFTQVPVLPLKAALAARLLVLGAHLGGRRLPAPRFLDAGETPGFVAWIDRRPRDGRPLVVNTLTSMAVRIAVAAQDRGVDLTGVTFRLQSEPLTDARYRVRPPGRASWTTTPWTEIMISATRAPRPTCGRPASVQPSGTRWSSGSGRWWRAAPR